MCYVLNWSFVCPKVVGVFHYTFMVFYFVYLANIDFFLELYTYVIQKYNTGYKHFVIVITKYSMTLGKSYFINKQKQLSSHALI